MDDNQSGDFKAKPELRITILWLFLQVFYNNQAVHSVGLLFTGNILHSAI